MATIKSYTDLEQSKVLAEILPLRSADMYYPTEGASPRFGVSLYISSNIPCWSLAALLDVIPEVSLNTFKDRKWNVMIQHDDKMIYEDRDNPVDACVAMIEKLNELNML